MADLPRPLSRQYVRRFAINGRFLAQTPTGVQRYAREIVTAMDTLLQEAGWKEYLSAEAVMDAAGARFSLDATDSTTIRARHLTQSL